eukprot:m.23194 g.23194  ORF g.23194 m.23194 type:complete len:687 (+) comp14112_c0_seq1:168-2228(+)
MLNSMAGAAGIAFTLQLGLGLSFTCRGAMGSTPDASCSKTDASCSSSQGNSQYTSPKYYAYGFTSVTETVIEVATDELITELKSQPQQSSISRVIGYTQFSTDMLVASRTTHKPCHYHGADARLQVVQGRYYFQVHTEPEKIELLPGDTFLTPAGLPHAEGAVDGIVVYIVSWSTTNLTLTDTIIVDEVQCNSTAFPAPTKPSLSEFGACKNHTKFELPNRWTATALLHPFSAPQSDPAPKGPYFSLSVADISYTPTQFQVHLKTCDGDEWWYDMQPGVFRGVRVRSSTDANPDGPGEILDLGWTFPSTNWLGEDDDPNWGCNGASPLNWMSPSESYWVKKADHQPLSPDSLNASSTWFWFDKTTGFPKRMMFGGTPLNMTHGIESKLGFFQMFSFSYITKFHAYPQGASMPTTLSLDTPSIPGFECGNPKDLPPFTWSSLQGLSSWLVPVNPIYNVLDTAFYYSYSADQSTQSVQVTEMDNTFNPNQTELRDTAVLFGANANDSILAAFNHCPGWIVLAPNRSNLVHNLSVDGVGLGQQKPDWISLGNKSATDPALVVPRIMGTISGESELTDSNETVAIWGVNFPPGNQKYSNGVTETLIYTKSNFLWTWYAYPSEGSQVTTPRPVVFMESASPIGEGTSLALADYFDFFNYEELAGVSGIKPKIPLGFLNLEALANAYPTQCN